MIISSGMTHWEMQGLTENSKNVPADRCSLWFTIELTWFSSTFRMKPNVDSMSTARDTNCFTT